MPRKGIRINNNIFLFGNDNITNTAKILKTKHFSKMGRRYIDCWNPENGAFLVYPYKKDLYYKSTILTFTNCGDSIDLKLWGITINDTINLHVEIDSANYLGMKDPPLQRLLNEEKAKEKYDMYKNTDYYLLSKKMVICVRDRKLYHVVLIGP